MRFDSIRSFLTKPDLGLLILRLGMGGMMAAVGISKFLDGSGALSKMGGVMASVGLDFAPVFWGFLAAGSMAVGGICVVLGYLYKLSTFMIFATMVMAVVLHVNMGDDLFFGGGAHALKTCIAFFAMMFIGPGRYSVQSSS